jgi:hypothetical protein
MQIVEVFFCAEFLASSSYVPSSEADYKDEDDDAHLDREKCETVTQMMLLAFLNAILNRFYHLSIEDNLLE